MKAVPVKGQVMPHKNIRNSDHDDRSDSSKNDNSENDNMKKSLNQSRLHSKQNNLKSSSSQSSRWLKNASTFGMMTLLSAGLFPALFSYIFE